MSKSLSHSLLPGFHGNNQIIIARISKLATYFVPGIVLNTLSTIHKVPTLSDNKNMTLLGGNWFKVTLNLLPG